MLASLAVQELVLSDVKKLEKRYGRATVGRIVVKVPTNVTNPAACTTLTFT